MLSPHTPLQRGVDSARGEFGLQRTHRAVEGLGLGFFLRKIPSLSIFGIGKFYK